MGRKVFHFAKLRIKFETNKYKHSKVAIFFLRVKNRISKEENSNKKEALSSIEERKQYFCVSQNRERKYLPKFFPSSSSFLSIFSITPLGVFLFVRLFVCSFVCLFVKCAYAREETCAISSFAGTCTPSNSTKRHKKGENRQKTRAISSFAGTCMPSKSTKRHKKRENQQKTRASSSFAGTCNPSNSTKRRKKGENQQKARASSSFAGYSTRFRGTFSLFLARKTLKNDFTHWNIVQMKIFQGLYSRISRSERWVFFFWLKFDFCPLQGAFFCSFRPYFSTPKNNLFPSLHYFYPPRNTSILFTKYQFIIHETPSRRREIDNKRGSIDNTYIKRKLRINKKKTTRKTRRSNT